jgi:hypothetical protein
MRYPPRMRERLRVIRMTPALRAKLERDPALVPRSELRRDGLAVRMIAHQHRRTGTRYRHVEDERGGERWYWFFYREVERQCQFACMAYEDLTQASGEYYQPRPAPPEPNSEDVAQIQLSMARHEKWLRGMAAYEQKRAAAYGRLWYAVQAFLVASGNISKLLWPSRKRLFPERGHELRAGLEVEESSPLKPRTFRNHFEHFDERLEQWVASPEPRTLTDLYIGPEGAISGLELDTRLRHFDPATFTVTFRGDTYRLQPIIEAIQAIHQRATAKCRERAWGIPDQT